MIALLAWVASQPPVVVQIAVGTVCAVVLALVLLLLDSGPDDDDPFNKTGW